MAEEKGKDIEPTQTDIVLLTVHSLMEANPFYENIPKPTITYIENFLAQQPSLQTMPFLQKRESFLNLIALCWMRDLLLTDIIKVQNKKPDKWKDDVEPKELRLLMKIVQVIDEIMPGIFKEDESRLEADRVAKKIVTTLTVERVEFDLKGLPETPLGEDVIDADFRIVEKNEKKSGGQRG